MTISDIIDNLSSSKIAWYPSSGLDFRDLLYLGQRNFILNKDAFANELILFEFISDLFIHTDNAYNSSNWPLNSTGKIYNDNNTTYYINKIQNIYNENKTVVGKFLELELQSKLLETNIKKNVLFLFIDNLRFLKEYAFKKRMEIHFIINIRDGFSENGGADNSMKFIEYFLGLLNTKYLISDNFGRPPIISNKIFNDEIIKSAFNSPKNKPIILQGLKEWTWSNFGSFNGDAYLMKVHSPEQLTIPIKH